MCHFQVICCQVLAGNSNVVKITKESSTFERNLFLPISILLFIMCIIFLSDYYISKQSKYHKNLHLPLDLRFIFISPQEYLQSSIKRDFIVMRKLTAVFVMELKIANLRGKSGKCQYFTSSNTSETLTILSISIWWSPLHYWSLFPRKHFFLFDGPKFGKKCSCMYVVVVHHWFTLKRSRRMEKVSTLPIVMFCTIFLYWQKKLFVCKISLDKRKAGWWQWPNFGTGLAGAATSIFGRKKLCSFW